MTSSSVFLVVGIAAPDCAHWKLNGVLSFGMCPVILIGTHCHSYAAVIPQGGKEVADQVVGYKKKPLEDAVNKLS